MPDWMSHLLIGLIVAELFNVRKKSLVLLGTFIPDLIPKLFLLFFYSGFPNFISLTSFHTPLVCFLLSILIAPSFKCNSSKTIFLINIGLITHFLPDFTMRHFLGGIPLCFPFSMTGYNIYLIWPEQSIYVLIFSLLVYICIRVVKKIDFEKVKI